MPQLEPWLLIQQTQYSYLAMLSQDDLLTIARYILPPEPAAAKG